jgi:integrase
MTDMPRPRPPHLHHETTRHGRRVWYVRIGKGQRVRIRAAYGTDAFWEEYRAALAGGRAPAAAGKIVTGSIAWLVQRYIESAEWADLSPATRKQRHYFYRTMAAKSGHLPHAKVNKASILAGRDALKDRPHAANNFLKAMRGLFGWAVDRGYRKDDPSRGVLLLKGPNDDAGFHAWTDDEVAAYEARWPIGTRQRLALDLLLYTGLRRGDVVRLGRPHVKDGIFRIRTEKTGTLVIAPIVPQLARSIAASVTGELTYLTTERGKPFGKESFGTWFAKACRAAGVPGSAHGLRKAGARRIAERGGSEALLNALYGWKEGSRESATYVATANRARMAAEAAKLLAREMDSLAPSGASEGQNENKTPAPGDQVRAIG